MRHRVGSIRFARGYMLIRIDAREYRIDLAETSPRLLRAKKVEKETYRISPSSYGIHWPLLDEDLSVDALIRSAKPEKISA